MYQTDYGIAVGDYDAAPDADAPDSLDGSRDESEPTIDAGHDAGD
jgi:hypothetical protein